MPSNPLVSARPGIGTWLNVRSASLTLATAIVYFVVAKLSLVFAIPPGFASAVWPPAGIAAAALLLGGARLWPGVWLGLTAANLTIQPSLAAPFAIGFGGALEALFIVWGWKRLIGRPDALFTGAGQVFRFVGLALAGAALSASVANLTLALAGTLGTADWLLNWLTWWLGDAMGVILLTPLIVAVATRRAVALSTTRAVELAFAAAALFAIVAVVCFEYLPLGNVRAVTFLLLVPLVWIAARFGAIEITVAAALTGALAMLATVIGRGPFVSASLNESLLLQQAFVCTIGVVGLALSVTINELRRAHGELEELVSLASHDLQEPVRNMIGYADLLQRRHGDRLDDDGHEFIGYIVSGALRMRRLIDDLLALSRASRAVLETAPIDGRPAFDAALEQLATAIDESGAEVRCEALPSVLADGPLLERVFQNLIGNALRFRGDAPPRVHVSALRDGRRWVFAVRDNGIGIAAADQERIFGMFERLHGRGRSGAGMGLALCRRIIERHGGRIWVESEPMRGATFYFSLPAADGTGH